MHVIVVDFEIHESNIADFREAVVENAKASLEDEPGCKQFDVCWDPMDESKVFLYEVYDNKKAFDLHLASEHFQFFNAKTAAWIADKSISVFQRAYPNT